MTDRLRIGVIVLAGLVLGAQGELRGQQEAEGKAEFPKVGGTVLFLGDSITHAGHYVSLIEAVTNDDRVELVNLGLPSEGVTGLSEPAHPFPRPNVHERLDRALAKVEPDLVLACYGMNDGIYHPFSEERFAAYQDGINRLIEKVEATGAPLILVTPPPFDPEPLRAKGKLKPAGADEYAWFEIYENYDTEVLAKYSEWLKEQANRKGVAMVVDARTPVLDYVAEKRKTDPDFTLSNDGVHLNQEGHTLLAKAILEATGRDPAAVDAVNAGELILIHEAQSVMHDAWLSEVGHLRPQVKPGLPLWLARIVTGGIPEPEQANVWTLFNGKDLKGWKGWEKWWSVEEGQIVGRNEEPVPSSTYLFTEGSFREFRLLFEVKQTVSPKHSTMHSAVASLGEPIEDQGGNDFGFKGPLLMFCHDWGIWDAHRRNRVEPAGQKGPMKIASEAKGDWNRIEILVVGNRIRFVNNGKLVFDFTDDPEKLQASPIGLQLHKNGKPQEFRFRGLVLTEYPEDRLLTLEK